MLNIKNLRKRKIILFTASNRYEITSKLCKIELTSSNPNIDTYIVTKRVIYRSDNLCVRFFTNASRFLSANF